MCGRALNHCNMNIVSTIANDMERMRAKFRDVESLKRSESYASNNRHERRKAAALARKKERV